MEIVVIGCTHAGTAAIINIKNLHPDANITMYERNDNISFLSCGIALYIEGVVKETKGLFYSSPEELEKLGTNVNIRHDVTSIDPSSKTVVVKNLDTQEVITKSYDKLVITSGSWPIIPNLPGSDLDNILPCKNFNHAKEIIKKAENAKNVAIIGAGYIGVELVEAFEKNNKNVILVDLEKSILCKYMDKEFSDIAQKEYKNKNITLALGEELTSFEGDKSVKKIITNKNSYDVDLVIMCIGFKPNTEIFKNHIDMLKNGAIIVNEYMQTSNKDIFAAGDCCAIHYNPTDTKEYIPLATNAVRMGTLVAKNIVNPSSKYIGTQGTSGIKIYNQLMATTGLTESEAKKYFKNVKSVIKTDSYRPEFMPTHTEATLKLVYDGDNKVLLGAQITSTADYTQTINTLSICIQNKMTVDELSMVDQFFQPHFNKPWNLVNSTALTAN